MTKQNTKKATKKVHTNAPQAFAVGNHDGQILAAVPYTLEDFKNSLLVVSLAVNLVILVVWLLTVVSGTHASAVAQFILQ